MFQLNSLWITSKNTNTKYIGQNEQAVVNENLYHVILFIFCSKVMHTSNADEPVCPPASSHTYILESDVSWLKFLIQAHIFMHSRWFLCTTLVPVAFYWMEQKNCHKTYTRAYLFQAAGLEDVRLNNFFTALWSRQSMNSVPHLFVPVQHLRKCSARVIQQPFRFTKNASAYMLLVKCKCILSFTELFYPCLNRVNHGNKPIFFGTIVPCATK